MTVNEISKYPENKVKSATVSQVFLRNLEVFGNVVKHCFSVN